MKTSTTAKEEILSRIKSGLSQKAAEAQGVKSDPKDVIPSAPQPREPSDLHHQFKRMLELVGGECDILQEEDSLKDNIQRLIENIKPELILIQPDPELAWLHSTLLLLHPAIQLLTPTSGNLIEAEKAELGITMAQAGIADTGTVVLVHACPHDRLSALLAVTHLVLVRRDAIYPNKRAYLQQMREIGFDLGESSMSWITGPSSTADIEKVLVRGAHGPRRLLAVLY
jgi:L-lactate dehydrogenase complex protein LldG